MMTFMIIMVDASAALQHCSRVSGGKFERSRSSFTRTFAATVYLYMVSIVNFDVLYCVFEENGSLEK
jgi:hypothetical protein